MGFYVTYANHLAPKGACRSLQIGHPAIAIADYVFDDKAVALLH